MAYRRRRTTIVGKKRLKGTLIWRRTRRSSVARGRSPKHRVWEFHSFFKKWFYGHSGRSYRTRVKG